MSTSCHLCSHASRRFLAAQDYNQGLTQGVFNYYRCPACKLIFLSPVPDNLQAYYPSSYPAYQRPSLAELDMRAETERYKLNIIQQFVANGRLLEIGPGYGGFAYLAKKAGFDVSAIEMDPGCSDYLNTVIGVRSINASNIEAALQNFDTHYDVVVMWHVVEHLKNPWSVLGEIEKKIAPQGILVISAPNPDAFQFKLFGKYWTHLDAPRHLALIPKQLLTDQVNLHGLVEIFSSTRDQASIIFSSFGWWMVSFNNAMRNFVPRGIKLANDAEMKCQSHVSGEIESDRKSYIQIVIRIIKKVLKFGLKFIYDCIVKPLERMEGRGNAYTVVYRKLR